MKTVVYQGKTFAIVPDTDEPNSGCGSCVGTKTNLGICVEFGAMASGPNPNCARGEHHYEEVSEAQPA